MTESFLHYLWQFQYFDKRALTTTVGDEVCVLHPGYKNVHSGPDFFNARIRMGKIEWVGNVEIHIFASGWIEHKHNGDPAYDNVVLHVVWKSDKVVNRTDGSLMPTLSLQGRVAEKLILQYKTIAQNPDVIPCGVQFGGLHDGAKSSMLNAVMMERLDHKAADILALLQRNNNDWEETCYQVILKNFGFKVNSEPFENLANVLPYRLLQKHGDRLVQIEALLFGQAGLLEESAYDDYYSLLQREYRLLSRKYNLSDRQLNKVQWRFLRLRPANFPTIRIAQFAALLFHRRNLFSSILMRETGPELQEFFATSLSGYWLNHYHFTKDVRERVPSLGITSIENIIINSVVPMLTAYGKSRVEDRYLLRAVCILQAMRPEVNMITKKWKSLGLNLNSAFDTQAGVQLFNQYCLKRRCLECSIGTSILNPGNS